MIKLQNISRHYGRVSAVFNVSLAIEKNERLVIQGPSGCGKTTLLRLIAGLETPDSGEIYIHGRLANDPRPRLAPHRRAISMVFQDLALWPHMNIEQTLAFGLDNIIRDRRKRRDEMDAMLTKLGLEKKRKAYPSQLSGGEQQRVALGRALIRKPQILLMDEPLANLDFAAKEKFVGFIKDLQRQFRITLVYVTHDEYEATHLGDRIAFMTQGQIEKVRDHIE
ncbi:MAG: ABC transporter ATP-binding protein [Candidatus Omnitrophota bacterium]